MRATTHPRNGHPDEFRTASFAGRDHCGRRTGGARQQWDGWFDARDTQGVQDLNDTFKIHRGSHSNTDSAGCQTIGGGEYDDFVSTVRGTPGQNRWQYVLTSVAPGQTRELGQDVPLAANDDPRQPQHRDHALQQQISTRLQALGGRYAEHAEDYSLVMLREAKAAGITRVDQIVASNPSAGRAAGETLFLVQGSPAILRRCAQGSMRPRCARPRWNPACASCSSNRANRLHLRPRRHSSRTRRRWEGVDR